MASFLRRPELDSPEKQQHRPALRDSSCVSEVWKLESTVRQKPNYYEMLGLTPTAASDEIAKAFAKATSVFRPHVFGAITEACIAYETLRNPAKRRAYDASLGLRPEPRLPISSTRPQEAPSSPNPVSPYPVERSAVGVAARQPSNPNPRDSFPSAVPKPELLDRPEIAAKPRLEPQIGGEVSRHLALEQHLGVEVSPIDWKRTGMAAGAVAGAACFLGALGGWWSSSDIDEPQQPQDAVSVPLPLTKPLAAAEVPPPAPASTVIEARPRPKRAAIAAEQVVGAPTLPKSISADEQPLESPTQESRPDQIELDSPANEQTAPETPVNSTATASMPLPKTVIARTIERIGYACGGVASTTPVEGEAPGVFKVTCASGQSYQAKPIKGRYHFRRWGRP